LLQGDVCYAILAMSFVNVLIFERSRRVAHIIAMLEKRKGR